MDFSVDERLARAATLPAPLYTDPAVLAAEKTRVFGASWQLVGRADQVARPGDFFTARVADEEVLVVRGEDEKLRALSNVCRHRAGPVASGAGSCRALRCGYHGWTYGLDGRLLATPEFEGVENFRREDVRLPEFSVATWIGLVFANLDARAPALAATLEDLSGRLEEKGLGSMRFAFRREWTLDCNWKVYVDNYLEGYHIPDRPSGSHEGARLRRLPDGDLPEPRAAGLADQGEGRPPAGRRRGRRGRVLVDLAEPHAERLPRQLFDEPDRAARRGADPDDLRVVLSRTRTPRRRREGGRDGRVQRRDPDRGHRDLRGRAARAEVEDVSSAAATPKGGRAASIISTASGRRRWSLRASRRVDGAPAGPRLPGPRLFLHADVLQPPVDRDGRRSGAVLARGLGARGSRALRARSWRRSWSSPRAIRRRAGSTCGRAGPSETSRASWRDSSTGRATCRSFRLSSISRPRTRSFSGARRAPRSRRAAASSWRSRSSGLVLASAANVRGLKYGTWLHNAAAVATWIPAILLVVSGAVVFARFGSATSFSAAHLIPSAGLKDALFFSTIAFAFGGIETASFLGDEIRDPRRNLPRALLVVGGLITAAYLAGTASLLVALPASEASGLTGITHAIAAASAKAGLPGMGTLAALLITLAGVGVTGAWLATASRLPFVGGLDRFLPPAFAKVHPRWGTPAVAILVQSGLSARLRAAQPGGDRGEGRIRRPRRHERDRVLRAVPLSLRVHDQALEGRRFPWARSASRAAGPSPSPSRPWAFSRRRSLSSSPSSRPATGPDQIFAAAKIVILTIFLVAGGVALYAVLGPPAASASDVARASRRAPATLPRPCPPRSRPASTPRGGGR